MKMKMALSCLLTIFLFISCGKDKFTTVPQIKIKSIKPGTVTQNDIIELRSSFTDQEGDVDSVLILYKWYNGTVSIKARDTLRYSIEVLEIPKNTKQGDIVISFEYGSNNDEVPDITPTPSIRDTTAAFGLVIKDKAGNRSDYAESDKIRLIKF